MHASSTTAGMIRRPAKVRRPRLRRMPATGEGPTDEAETRAGDSPKEPETPGIIAGGYLSYERFVRQITGDPEGEPSLWLIEKRNEYAGKLIDHVIATRPPAVRVGDSREASLLARCVRVEVPCSTGNPPRLIHESHIFGYDDATDQLIEVRFVDREIGPEDVAGM